MDKLFSGLKKTLVSILFVAFGFVTTYVPINHQGHVPVAEAGGLGGGALEVTQLLNKGLLFLGNEFNLATSIATAAEKLKSFQLDGIAWQLAKQALATMTDSIVRWIQSGFDGRPGFLEDIDGMLLETADRVFGEYIEELGGDASFLCDPFRLDIQLALSIQYSRSQQAAPTCTITDIVDNVDDFINETERELSNNGWESFFIITTRPNSNTPYGSYLAAENELNNRIAQEQAENLQEANFSGGFLSYKQCEDVPIPGTSSTKENCSIVTPGKTIQEALSNSLDSERQSLLEADELSELLGSMFSAISSAVIFQAGGSLLDI
jgi:hypothetical protein